MIEQRLNTVANLTTVSFPVQFTTTTYFVSANLNVSSNQAVYYAQCFPKTRDYESVTFPASSGVPRGVFVKGY